MPSSWDISLLVNTVEIRTPPPPEVYTFNNTVVSSTTPFYLWKALYTKRIHRLWLFCDYIEFFVVFVGKFWPFSQKGEISPYINTWAPGYIKVNCPMLDIFIMHTVYCIIIYDVLLELIKFGHPLCLVKIVLFVIDLKPETNRDGKLKYVCLDCTIK